MKTLIAALVAVTTLGALAPGAQARPWHHHYWHHHHVWHHHHRM